MDTNDKQAGENPSPPTENREAAPTTQPVLASVVTLVIALSALLTVFGLTDWPLAPVVKADDAPTRGVLAIRDDVIPFQKWGTRIFTLLLLESVYDDVRYYTEPERPRSHQFFRQELEDLLDKHETVDVLLLAHSNRYAGLFARFDPKLRKRVRLVYNTGCRDASQGPRWVDSGADTYVGHRGLSASPIFYFYFLRRWVRGHELDSAIAESNRHMNRLLGTVELLSAGAIDADVVYENSEAERHGRGGYDIDEAPR